VLERKETVSGTILATRGEPACSSPPAPHRSSHLTPR